MTLFRPEKRISNSLAETLAYAGVGRRVKAGVAVTDETSLALAAVWGCVDLIAELLSTLPVDEYKRGPEGELITLGHSALTEDPAGDGYGFEVWCRQLLMSALLRGNGYGWIEAIGTDGWPTQIAMLHPDEITTRVYSSTRADWYRDGKEVTRWPSGPLWHFAAYTFPGSPIGLSPLRYAAETIGVGIAAQKFGAQWFGDGAHPTSVLESDHEITKDQADTLKRRVVDALNGTREPLVLGLGTKMNPIQVSPEESQFLETIKANADDVASFFFRRPPGEAGSLTYANVEARSLDLLTYTLNGWMVRVEKALTRLRPRPRFVKFNADALVRVDLTTRYRAHDMAIRAGWESRNDVRHIEDLPPITDGTGDEYLWPPYRVTPDVAQPGLADAVPRG